MNPSDIGFTQNTVNNQGKGYTVQGNIEALQAGNLNPNEMGDPIRVFLKTSEMDNWGSMTKNGHTGDPQNLINEQWYTLDNRRLFAFQKANIESINVQVIDSPRYIRGQSWKFTTTNWGKDAT